MNDWAGNSSGASYVPVPAGSPQASALPLAEAGTTRERATHQCLPLLSLAPAVGALGSWGNQRERTGSGDRPDALVLAVSAWIRALAGWGFPCLHSAGNSDGGR